MRRLEYRLASVLLRVVGLLAGVPPGPSRPRRPRDRPGPDARREPAPPPPGDDRPPPRAGLRPPARAVQLRAARQARLPRPARPRHVPPPDGPPVRRRQRVPADPRRAAPADDDGRPGLARGGRAQAVRAWTPTTPLAEPERTFLHRYYDAVVVGGEWTRAAVRRRAPDAARAGPRARLAADRLLLRRGGDGGRPGERVLAAHPVLAGRRVVLYAPTFRGRGIGKRAAPGLDAVRLRAALPRRPRRSSSRPTRTSIRRRPRPPASTSWPTRPADINDLLPATDILITDYSSSVIEFALLRRPIVLLVPDLAEYERDPGLYLDYRTEMIGTQVADTDGVIDAIAERPVRPVRLRRVHRAPARAAPRRRERPLRRPVPRGRTRPSAGEVIPFRAMSATSEVPAAFRHAAGERGPLRLIR